MLPENPRSEERIPGGGSELGGWGGGWAEVWQRCQERRDKAVVVMGDASQAWLCALMRREAME